MPYLCFLNKLCKKKPFLLIEKLNFAADVSKQKTCLCCQGKDSGQSYHRTSFVAFGWTSPAYGWWQPTSESFKCFDAEDSGHYFLKMLLFRNVFRKLFLNSFFLSWFIFLFFVQDNADRTSSFVVLINLLRPLEPSRWPSTGSKESFASRNQKFSDLVVKCLIKLTKVCIHYSH